MADGDPTWWPLHCSSPGCPSWIFVSKTKPVASCGPPAGGGRKVWDPSWGTWARCQALYFEGLPKGGPAVETKRGAASMSLHLSTKCFEPRKQSLQPMLWTQQPMLYIPFMLSTSCSPMALNFFFLCSPSGFEGLWPRALNNCVLCSSDIPATQAFKPTIWHFLLHSQVGKVHQTSTSHWQLLSRRLEDHDWFQEPARGVAKTTTAVPGSNIPHQKRGCGSDWPIAAAKGSWNLLGFAVKAQRMIPFGLCWWSSQPDPRVPGRDANVFWLVHLDQVFTHWLMAAQEPPVLCQLYPTWLGAIFQVLGMVAKRPLLPRSCLQHGCQSPNTWGRPPCATKIFLALIQRENGPAKKAHLHSSQHKSALKCFQEEPDVPLTHSALHWINVTNFSSDQRDVSFRPKIFGSSSHQGFKTKAFAYDSAFPFPFVTYSNMWFVHLSAIGCNHIHNGMFLAAATMSQRISTKNSPRASIAMGNQCFKDPHDSQKKQVENNVVTSTQVPDVQQMPLQGTWEAGEDLTHAVAGHPWSCIAKHQSAPAEGTWGKPVGTNAACCVVSCGVGASRFREKGLIIHKSNRFHCLAACVPYGWFPTSWNKSIFAKSLDSTMHVQMTPSALTQGSFAKRWAATRSLHLSTQCFEVSVLMFSNHCVSPKSFKVKLLLKPPWLWNIFQQPWMAFRFAFLFPNMPQQAIVGIQNQQPLFFEFLFYWGTGLFKKKVKARSTSQSVASIPTLQSTLISQKNVAAREAFQFLPAIQTFASSILLSGNSELVSGNQSYYGFESFPFQWFFECNSIFTHTKMSFCMYQNIQKLTNLTIYNQLLKISGINKTGSFKYNCPTEVIYVFFAMSNHLS